jgi:uncharacterized membrane protein YphA (DoxX/SURF4 family)
LVPRPLLQAHGRGGRASGGLGLCRTASQHAGATPGRDFHRAAGHETPTGDDTKLGLEAAAFAGHSLRAGFVTSAVKRGAIELVGGVLIVLGLFTRPVAFILAGDMAVAYFIAHAPRGFFPLLNAGELAIIYCFVFLYLAVAGGGVWSLDHLRAGKKASPVAWRT